MSDYIMNRASLKRHCKAMCEKFKDVPTSGTYGGHRLILNLLEQTEWIPVSEAPKENGWYQCSVDASGGSTYVMDLFYKDGKWLDNRRIDMFNIYHIYGYGNCNIRHQLSFNEFDEFDWTRRVIAWMPLPETYRSESKYT